MSTYRDELEAAHARIQSLEEEVARLRGKASAAIPPASRRLLDELYAERDRALAAVDRTYVFASRYGLPTLALGVVGMAFLAVAQRGDVSLVVPSGLVGVIGIVFGVILMAVRWTTPASRRAVERAHRIRIAEAEAQAEIGARVHVAAWKRARIASAGSDDDEAAVAELEDDAALDQRRLRR